MVRQYIGARYVPKFYENSDGNAEWRAGVIYEPLTIVTYNGNSYTSKKNVPSIVGNPSANPTYWAATGLYSEQVELLRQQVETLQEDVDTVAHKRYIFIGDSYMWGWYNSTQITSFLDIAVSVLGLQEGVDYYRNNANGSGFAYTIQANKKFIDLIMELENTVSDPDKITDIIVIGSANDIDQTSANIETAISGFVSYCKSHYQNAVVHIGAVGGFAFDPARQTDLVHVRNTYRSCTKFGAVYMTGIEWVVHNHATEWDRATDNLHFNATGQNHLALAFIQYLLNGKIDNTVDTYQTTCAASDVISSPGGFNYDSRQSDGVCYIEPTAPIWDITLASETGIGPNYQMNFGTISLSLINACCNSNASDMLHDCVPCLLGDGSTGFIDFTYKYSDNSLNGRFRITGSHNVTNIYTVKPSFMAMADFC